MLALLKKDLLLNRVAIAGNALLIFMIYFTVVIAMCTSTPRHRAFTNWSEAAAMAAIWSIGITCLLGAIYGGVTFAQERRERSSNFLAMMPVTRKPIIISKLIVAWGCLITFALLNAIVLLAASVVMMQSEGTIRDGRVWDTSAKVAQAVSVGLAVTVMLFGVSWLLSIRLESPSIAASVSIAAVGFLNLLIALLVDRSGLFQNERADLQWLLSTSISFGFGAACIVVGSIHYLTRTEP